MAYLALYRQWRPQTFSQMVGQTAVMETLRNQVVTGRIAHAYLFCGSRGTGKTSTAKILAKAINCEHPENGDPCGQCETCRRAENEETLDIVEIDAASNNGVDEMRELRETVKYPPQYGKYKVYIIDEVHMLSVSAFNALLKTLEEPPAHVVFILATTEPQKLPATILSRCQRFDFGRISAALIAGRLREAADGAGAEATDGALMQIARAAEGGMRDALSILDMCVGYGAKITEELVRDVLGTSDRGFLFRFSRAMCEEDAATVFGMIDELMRNGREPSVFGREFGAHIRALLLAKCCPEDMAKLMEMTEEDAGEYIQQSEAFTVTRLMKILDLFLALDTEMRYAASPRYALESTSLKACLRTEETDAQALTDRIEELEKKMERLAADDTAYRRMSEAPAASDEADRRRPAATKTAPGKAAGPAKAEAGANGAPDQESVWKAAIQQIKKTDPGIYVILAQGSFIGAVENEYRWQPSMDNPVYVQSLNKPEKNQRVAACLTEAAGGAACSFRAMDLNRGAEAPRKPAEDLLAPVIETLGRERISVVETMS